MPRSVWNFSEKMIMVVFGEQRESERARYFVMLTNALPMAHLLLRSEIGENIMDEIADGARVAVDLPLENEKANAFSRFIHHRFPGFKWFCPCSLSHDLLQFDLLSRKTETDKLFQPACSTIFALNSSIPNLPSS